MFGEYKYLVLECRLTSIVKLFIGQVKRSVKN